MRVFCQSNDRVLHNEVQEILDLIRSQAQNDSLEAVAQKLLKAQQVLAFEVDREGATEDCWVMLDALEAYIANKLNGFIYAPADGFYDAALQPLYKFVAEG